MISSSQVFYQLALTIILLFTCLALGVACKQARVHLPWLIPLALSQTFGWTSNLFSLLMIEYVASQGISYSPVTPFVFLERIMSGGSLLFLVWFSVALFLTLQSKTDLPQQPVPQPDPEVWPPPSPPA